MLFEALECHRSLLLLVRFLTVASRFAKKSGDLQRLRGAKIVSVLAGV